MQEEKNRIERVLGAISAPDLIQKVLAFALSVHTTDSPRVVFALWCLCVIFFAAAVLDDDRRLR